ncbi:major pollen allergen Lol p 11-like [Trifolium pratense]|uniref:Uncharacterized protein n=2 Tax=Trifolium pratense TaxID=57577 RepID=A0ACB0JGX5_TRIPR|nr:major pollen allergen Lol p 11-like [Trifolium pratense]CAJ2644346.1 unnamed protein product [Trifolium pratense]CAJ2661732.1 unnamed protein product [Trifolium pratense]
MASRVALLMFLCVLPAMVSAIRPAKNPFCLKGHVVCDPCRAGYETSAVTHIAGAEVLLECKKRVGAEVVFTTKAETDSTGEYTIYVNEDHKDQVCDVKLVSSPQNSCNEVVPGRDQARVILTGYNGIASNDRYANAMLFRANEVASGCAEILKQMQELEEDN